jgi:putative nucleotidyltransferase with HDIG domain
MLEMTERDDVTAADLERLTNADQALASRVLRVANSAYYGLERQVESVVHATVILGLRQVRNLALSLSAAGMFHAQTRQHQELHARFWTLSLGTAIGSQLLAARRRLDARGSDGVYVGGLLHDVGRLFLLTHMTDLYIRLCSHAKKQDIRLVEAEQSQLGITHVEVGVALAEKWGFPESLAHVIAHHEGPLEPEVDVQLATVNVASALAREIFEDENAVEIADPVAWEWAGLDEESLLHLKSEIEVRVQSFGAGLIAEAA